MLERSFMDLVDVIVLLGLTLIIIRYIMDVRELVIPTKKRKIEIIGLTIGTLVVLWLMYRYANLISHYIVGVLGIVTIHLTVFRLGMTSRGFKGNRRGPFTWTWDKLSSVRVTINKDIKIKFYRKYTFDIHIYKIEDYDSLMEILRENLSYEQIKLDNKQEK